MKRTAFLISFLLVALLNTGNNLAIADSPQHINSNDSNTHSIYYAVTEAEKSEFKQVTQIANAFANSHLLGTGASQYLTRIKSISGDGATAFVGESSADGDDPEAYKVNLQKINGKWKVVTYEFKKIGTTGDLKRLIRRVDMHRSLYPSLELVHILGQREHPFWANVNSHSEGT